MEKFVGHPTPRLQEESVTKATTTRDNITALLIENVFIV